MKHFKAQQWPNIIEYLNDIMIICALSTVIFKPDYITESRVIRILNLYFLAWTLYWENITSEFCKLIIFINFSKLISVFELEFFLLFGNIFSFLLTQNSILWGFKSVFNTFLRILSVFMEHKYMWCLAFNCFAVLDMLVSCNWEY